MLYTTILMLVCLIVGFAGGALVYFLGIRKGMSVAERLIGIWSKTEKSRDESKLKTLQKIAQARSGSAQIGSYGPNEQL